MAKQIALTQGQFALVDDEDFERVNAHKWRASWESRGTKYYAKRGKKMTDDSTRWQAQQIRMHHFVLDVAPSELDETYCVHHKNDDGLDNRKENLEIITLRANMLAAPGWKKRRTEEVCL